jgi:hypothetical protein
LSEPEIAGASQYHPSIVGIDVGLANLVVVGSDSRRTGNIKLLQRAPINLWRKQKVPWRAVRGSLIARRRAVSWLEPMG